MLCVAAHAIAQQPFPEKVLRTYSWQDLLTQHPSPNCEIVSMDGISVLKIGNTNNAPQEITFLTITDSALLKKAELIALDVKYENVQEELIPVTNRFGNRRGPWESAVSGSLTLLLHYPPEAQGGDENTNSSSYDLEGTSNWKPQTFNVGPYPGAERDIFPTQAELKIKLPATGTVYVRPVKLIGYAQRWLSPQLGVVIGVVAGIGGAGIGCFGALIGCLVGLGKGRRFVLATTKMFIGLGILLMIAGIIAAACHLPWPAWYSMLLMGFVLAIVFSVNLYPIKRRYDELEIRRMTSMDATGR